MEVRVIHFFVTKTLHSGRRCIIYLYYIDMIIKAV